MKKFFSLVVMGGVLILVTATAQAQLPGTTIHATIPFDFIVRGKTLSAGRYEVRRVNDESFALLIRNVDHKHDTAVFETEPAYVGRMPSRNILVFNRYGDTYFLSEVETASEQTARELFPSRKERHLRQQMASNTSEPQTVEVACN